MEPPQVAIVRVPSVAEEIRWGRQYRLKRTEQMLKPLSPLPYPTNEIIEEPMQTWLSDEDQFKSLKQRKASMPDILTHLGRQSNPPSGQYIKNILKPKRKSQINQRKYVRVLKGSPSVDTEV